MSLYNIADYIVDIQNKYNFISRQCEGYEYEGAVTPDFIINVSEEEIQNERLISEEVYPVGYLESICAYRKLGMLLPVNNAILLHASVIDINSRGIAFLAPSGVGKTTHTMFWKKVYKEKVKIVNGDKPIIRFFNDIPFAYGTPWAGKENMHINTRVQLTDICFIERCEDNIVSQFDKNECIGPLMQQVLHPENPVSALKTLELLDSLLKNCSVWKIKCNATPAAAEIAYEKIFQKS